MIYIRTNSDNLVTFVHRKPFDPVNGLNATQEELEKTGFFIDELPDSNAVVGTRATAYFNPETKQVYYKYTAAPLSTKERLNLLEEAMNAQLFNTIDNKEDSNDGKE